jgi:uncharacterized protein YndB with AHSA1/START domain
LSTPGKHLAFVPTEDRFPFFRIMLQRQLDSFSLILTRRIKARPEKVYAAWTDPQKIVRWFGTASIKPGTERASIDARVGGRYRVSFDSDSGEDYDVGGIYHEVEPNRRLVFSWTWRSTPERESLVTVSLKPDGDGTLLTLQHEQLFDQAACESHERGWDGSLDKLQQFLT